MFRNEETLKVWRDKSKQMQLLESSYKLNSCNKIISWKYVYHKITSFISNLDPGLDIPFGVDKEFSKIISRQAYRKVIYYLSSYEYKCIR